MPWLRDFISSLRRILNAYFLNTCLSRWQVLTLRRYRLQLPTSVIWIVSLNEHRDHISANFPHKRTFHQTDVPQLLTYVKFLVPTYSTRSRDLFYIPRASRNMLEKAPFTYMLRCSFIAHMNIWACNCNYVFIYLYLPCFLLFFKFNLFCSYDFCFSLVCYYTVFCFCNYILSFYWCRTGAH